MPRGAELDDPVIRSFNNRLTDDQHRHIRICHENSGGYTIQRFYPAPHHTRYGCLDRPTAERHMKAAQEHFALLEDPDISGLVIPGQELRVIESKAGGYAIASTVEYLEADGFGIHTQWAQYGNHAPHQPQAVVLAGSILRYYAWIANNKPDMCLGDLARIEQHGILASGRLALLDTDPFISELQPFEEDGRDKIGHSLRIVHSWTRNIQSPAYRDETLLLIESVAAANELALP